MDDRLQLNAEFQADLQWWECFLISGALCSSPINARLATDASGSWGCGAYLAASGLLFLGPLVLLGRRCRSASKNYCRLLCHMGE